MLNTCILVRATCVPESLNDFVIDEKMPQRAFYFQCEKQLSQLMRLWYLSHRRPMKAQSAQSRQSLCYLRT